MGQGPCGETSIFLGHRSDHCRRSSHEHHGPEPTGWTAWEGVLCMCPEGPGTLSGASILLEGGPCEWDRAALLAATGKTAKH